MNPNDKIYVAGHRGLAGSAIVRALEASGYRNIITRGHAELDLTDQRAVDEFFKTEKPDFVFLAAAKVGGIHANRTYPAQFIHQNLAIQTNVIHQSYLHGVQRLLFLGSSCIYPKLAPQPIREEHLLTGPLEPTNDAYAVAKIAGIQMCWAYNQEYGTRFVPMMPNNLYGPGDNFDLLHSHVLPALIRKFHLGKLAMEKNWDAIAEDERVIGPIPAELKQALGLPGSAAGSTSTKPQVILWGTGAPRREFLYVDDMAEAGVRLMTTPWERLAQACPDPGHPLFNVGVGADQTIQAIAATTAQAVGYTGQIIWDSAMPDGTP
ncbi:MAG: GDP-L-fucose synthase, partial [Desulfobacteraceae bacterium]|nr:GDP-L-fucose synthase [Desulfobacteraceae bacterium]